jgi:hypothetical protein
MRPQVAVIAVVAVAVAITVVVLGTRQDSRLAGTNLYDAGSFSIVVQPGKQHCERGQFIPADTDRARMTIGSYGKPVPPIELTVTDESGRRLVDRRTPPAPREGVVVLPLGHTTQSPGPESVVCVRPVGSKIALGGFQKNARIEWLRPGEESYFQLSGVILHRFGIGKPGWTGGWTLIAAFGLMAGLCALTVRVLLREAHAA